MNCLFTSVAPFLGHLFRFSPTAGSICLLTLFPLTSFRGINSMCQIYPSFTASGFCAPLRKLLPTSTLVFSPTKIMLLQTPRPTSPTSALKASNHILKYQQSTNNHKILSKCNNTDIRLAQTKCRNRLRREENFKKTNYP